MDRVRFGRALGRGARLAARTAYEAVDAATAPSPASRLPKARPAEPSQRVAPSVPVPSTAAHERTLQVDRAVQAAGKVHGSVHGSVRQAKRSVFATVKRASHALTLEMTGSFFALFALSFSIAAWRARAGLHDRADAPHFWVYLVLAVLFAYFAGSNFVRAKKL